MDGFGGAINNRGSLLIVTNSTLNGNYVGNWGGAINNIDGSVIISNGTFFENNAYWGGAIRNDLGTMTVTNCTLSNNHAWYGGGIYNLASLTINNSTIASNHAESNGGGIYGDTYIINTIIANNQSGGDCYGTIADGGHNISSDDTCGFIPFND